ncbi:cytochrome P450 3A6-like [Centruroides vittatus]|uniref:cytochrome P450 3A6-like n=1 Tax=Centruroides vittatus TaxID=120091 RepID=UPI00350FFE09
MISYPVTEMRWRKQKFSVFSDNRIPGPKPSFWTGNLREIIQLKEFFEYENRKKYGNIFGYFLGAKPILLVNDPELIEIIQIKNFRNFCNKDFMLLDASIPHHIGTKSLPAGRDKNWKISRCILNPCFSSKRLKLMFYNFNEAIDEFFENIEGEEYKNENSFDVYPFYKKLTLDIICRTAFGFNCGVQKGKSNLFLESLGKFLNTPSSDISSLLSVCFPETEPIPTLIRRLRDYINSKYDKPSVKLLMDTLKDVIRQRKLSFTKKEDLLQSMIDGKIETKLLHDVNDEDLDAKNDKFQETEESTNVGNSHIRLSDDEITGNALVFMATGYGTTSSILAYASYYLATHLEIQEKAVKQLRTILEGKTIEIQYEDLEKLDYLDQIISETLRLHPASSLCVNRKVKKVFKYKGKTIPEDVIVSISPELLHRNPEYWNEPDIFNPDRFSPENKRNINATIYQPFGNGPRNCIGMRFALTVIKITLVRVLMKYKLDKPTDYVLRCNHSLYGSTPKDVYVRMTPRTI